MTKIRFPTTLSIIFQIGMDCATADSISPHYQSGTDCAPADSIRLVLDCVSCLLEMMQAIWKIKKGGQTKGGLHLLRLEALGSKVLAKVFVSLPTLLEYLQASVQYTQVGHGSVTVTRAQ